MAIITMASRAVYTSGPQATHLAGEVTPGMASSFFQGLSNIMIYERSQFYRYYTTDNPWPQGPSDGGRANCVWNISRKYDTSLSPDHQDTGGFYSGDYPGTQEGDYLGNWAGCPSLIDYSYPETSRPGWGMAAGPSGQWSSGEAYWPSINIDFRSIYFTNEYPSILVSFKEIVRRYYISIGEFTPPENARILRMWVAHDQYVTQPTYQPYRNLAEEGVLYNTKSYYNLIDNSPTVDWRYTSNSNGGWGIRPFNVGSDTSRLGYHAGFNYHGPSQFVANSESALTFSGTGASDWHELPKSAIDAAYAREALDIGNPYPIGMTFMSFLDSQLQDSPPIYPYMHRDSENYYVLDDQFVQYRSGGVLVFRFEIGIPEDPDYGRLRVMVNPSASALTDRWKFFSPVAGENGGSGAGKIYVGENTWVESG